MGGNNDNMRKGYRIQQKVKRAK
jgi:hypothetical protein